MTQVDMSKGVWRVSGRLPEPDGRRMTCFVDAEDEAEAARKGLAEGMATIESAKYYSLEQVAEMDAKAASAIKSMTPEEVEFARKGVGRSNEKPLRVRD